MRYWSGLAIFLGALGILAFLGSMVFFLPDSRTLSIGWVTPLDHFADPMGTAMVGLAAICLLSAGLLVAVAVRLVKKTRSRVDEIAFRINLIPFMLLVAIFAFPYAFKHLL